MKTFMNPEVMITIDKGENFTIALEAVPTAGYTWKEEHDPAFLRLLHPPKFLSDSAAIGGSVKEVFEFQAIEYGISRITMKYQREWEATAKETKVFNVHIAKEKS